MPQIKGGLPFHSGWEIRGRVRRTLNVVPGVLGYWEGLRRGQAPATKTVVVTSYVPLRTLKVSCSPPLAAMTVKKRDAEPHVFDVHITPDTGLLHGTFAFKVALEPIGVTGQHYPTKVVPVEGQVIEDIEALPVALLLGPRSVGEEVLETIVLRSASGHAIELHGVDTPAEGVIRLPSVSDVQDGCLACQIQVRIALPGEHTSTIRFHLRTTADEMVALPFRVSYYGMHSLNPGALLSRESAPSH